MPLLALSFVQKIVGSIGLAVILSLSLALFMADRRADKWEKQAAKLSAELQRISTEKDVQRETTKVTVAKAGKTRVDAERVARRIEEAPVTPGLCQTPEAVLQADL